MDNKRKLTDRTAAWFKRNRERERTVTRRSRQISLIHDAPVLPPPLPTSGPFEGKICGDESIGFVAAAKYFMGGLTWYQTAFYIIIAIIYIAYFALFFANGFVKVDGTDKSNLSMWYTHETTGASYTLSDDGKVMNEDNFPPGKLWEKTMILERAIPIFLLILTGANMLVGIKNSVDDAIITSKLNDIHYLSYLNHRLSHADRLAEADRHTTTYNNRFCADSHNVDQVAERTPLQGFYQM